MSKNRNLSLNKLFILLHCLVKNPIKCYFILYYYMYKIVRIYESM